MTSGRSGSFKVEHGLSNLEVIPITKDSVIVGNSLSADIRIDNQFISRQHFKVRFDSEAFFISDLGSTNGTYLNSTRLTPYEETILRDGSKIGLAKDEIVLIFAEPSRTTVRIPNLTNTTRNSDNLFDLSIDSKSKTVSVRGMLIPALPKKEFDILECLFQNRGKVVTRDEIAAAGWPERPHDVPNADIDQYIRRLRRKIEEIPSNPKIITTRVGYGYLMS